MANSERRTANMRIIAGTLKGRALKSPTWEGIRPTSDRLRETLFDILAPRIGGVRVLDVFAGTGAVGLEALSRGAERAVFIERDARAARLIAENAARCGVLDRCVIIRDTAERAMANASGGPFGVVVFDPPYTLPAIDEVMTRGLAVLAPNGILVLEHAWRRAPPEVGGARRTRTVRAGDSALSFYEATPGAAVAVAGPAARDERPR
jgi:16S rRNA (guanine(966)-N(2))-methyltransferase RsmD